MEPEGSLPVRILSQINQVHSHIQLLKDPVHAINIVYTTIYTIVYTIVYAIVYTHDINKYITRVKVQLSD